ncbi:hypothetical protein KUV95_12910 [Microbulbifer agarilyticus]|uniref:hypothetical protein n=1 Tax=Microbulbifer agarilyticus TaxID=260552 RepID=UPI001C952C05|nr:hypothetical protein [Microbulbifer agarilyticus]MBY6191640.1 hypothetical protein [Microbulbifer agarilyticus]MBY6212451.1 hypothetical protein [Microbulbifer agarilyticus]
MTQEKSQNSSAPVTQALFVTSSSNKRAALILAAAFACALALHPLPSAAQQEAADDASENTQQSDESENTAAPKAAVETTAAPKPKKTKTSIKAQSAQNADSYEATEEISEDLSVSYPVDI